MSSIIPSWDRDRESPPWTIVIDFQPSYQASLLQHGDRLFFRHSVDSDTPPTPAPAQSEQLIRSLATTLQAASPISLYPRADLIAARADATAAVPITDSTAAITDAVTLAGNASGQEQDIQTTPAVMLQ